MNGPEFIIASIETFNLFDKIFSVEILSHKPWCEAVKRKVVFVPDLCNCGIRQVTKYPWPPSWVNWNKPDADNWVEFMDNYPLDLGYD